MRIDKIGVVNSFWTPKCISKGDNEDQQIPDLNCGTRSGTRPIGTTDSGPKMDLPSQPVPRTIEEHVESQHQICHIFEHNYTTCSAGRYRKVETPPRPNNGKDLLKLVQRVYSQGRRSPQLLNLIHQSQDPIPLRVAMLSAEYIHRVWEAPIDRAQNVSTSANHRIHQLTNFIVSLLYRISPSLITVMLTVFYVGRLKRLYPQAQGEHGCSHRLFTIALLISIRYNETQGAVDDDFYNFWCSTTHGIFQAADLLRMELEFIAFLKFNLFVSYDDFEYFVDRVYNADSGQMVPRNLDVLEFTKPLGRRAGENGRDAFVPESEEY